MDSFHEYYVLLGVLVQVPVRSRLATSVNVLYALAFLVFTRGKVTDRNCHGVQESASGNEIVLEFTVRL